MPYIRAVLPNLGVAKTFTCDPDKEEEVNLFFEKVMSTLQTGTWGIRALDLIVPERHFRAILIPTDIMRADFIETWDVVDLDEEKASPPRGQLVWIHKTWRVWVHIRRKF
jgi:hypothetical protein